MHSKEDKQVSIAVKAFSEQLVKELESRAEKTCNMGTCVKLIMAAMFVKLTTV